MVIALTGFVVGGIVGLASGDDPEKTVNYGFFGTYTDQGSSAGDKTMANSIINSIPGAAVGAIIASKKVKILLMAILKLIKIN